MPINVQLLKDKDSNVIGKIVSGQRSDGKIELRNTDQKILGTYNPVTNTTYDMSNNPVGKGNILSTLLVVQK